MGNAVGINVSIALENAVSCCWRWRQACELEEDLESLKKDWEWLKGTRNDVKRKIESEQRQQMKLRLEQQVDDWLSRMEAIEAQVDKLFTDGFRESSNNCICGYCPKNCITSYNLGNKVAEMQEEVDALQRLKPDTIAETPLLTTAEERTIEPTLGSQSMFDEVWSYIEDDQVGMLGLYGMGGIGKTTLLTAVHNKLHNSTQMLFDVVIWIVVSKTPNLNEILNKIGKKIGFCDYEWKNKSQDDKSMDIFGVLSKKKYAVFLDDIWERLDLIKLGFPLPDQDNKSKVVFSTRSDEVCGNMEAHKQIKVQCLAWEEAWDLFQKRVGKKALNAHPEIPKLAKDVAKVCGGFPLALITIGQTMASKTTPEEWHHDIEVLKRYIPEFSGMGDEVFPILKFSYDSLPNAAIRSCFLYCSLYLEDYLMSKEELIDQWSCEGFLDKFDDIQIARNEGYSYINALVHASLLEECSPEMVKMNTVIRDMAIWIACECGAMEGKFFVLARAGLTRLPYFAEWEGAERVSLMVNNILVLSGAPTCPNLLTLFLNGNRLMISTTGFFLSMPNLRVLDLSNNKSLTKLPTDICELVSLQYLNLSHTSVMELPIEFQELINLKYLNLESTNIQIIPEGVLSSFKNLQTLKVRMCDLYNLWDGFSNAFVKELETLEYLNDLTITIKSESALSDVCSSRKLTSIITAVDLYRFSNSRYLNLLLLKEMTRLKKLEIASYWILEEMIIGKGKGTSSIISHNCFHSLRSVSMFDCPMLKDLTWLTFAPNLEDISISFCSGLKEVVGEWKWDEEDTDHQEEEGGRPTPFAKLKILHLQSLPQLKRIHPIALTFPCLETLKVFNDCSKLKKLPFNSSSCKSGCGITIWGEHEWWNGLEWEDEATWLAFQSSFQPVS